MYTINHNTVLAYKYNATQMICVVILFLFMSVQYGVTRVFLLRKHIMKKFCKKWHSKFRDWVSSVLIPSTSTG